MSLALSTTDYTGSNFCGLFGNEFTPGESQEWGELSAFLDETRNHLCEPLSSMASTFILQDRLVEIAAECNIVGWDGYDALPVSKETLEAANRFILMLPLTTLPTPDISPEPTGRIAFEWYKNKGLVFVASVDGAGLVHYAGVFGVGCKASGSEYLTSFLPPPIRENIFRLETRD